MSVPSPQRQAELQDEFFTKIAARLEAGREEYGDKSFEKSPSDLVKEIEEEILDIVGWSFIRWVQIREMNR